MNNDSNICRSSKGKVNKTRQFFSSPDSELQFPPDGEGFEIPGDRRSRECHISTQVLPILSATCSDIKAGMLRTSPRASWELA